MRVNNELGELKKINLYEQAIDSLLNYIIANDLKSGDKLPTENAMKDIFGISRNTLREALKSLQLIGIIETKQNSGIIIKDFSISDLTKFVPYSLRIKDNDNLKKVCEAREWLELSILPMILERRTDEDLQILKTIISEIDKHVRNKKNIDTLDNKFHLAMLDCCKNPFISNTKYIYDIYFSLSGKEGSPFAQTSKSTNDEHKIIFECIEKRNLEKLQNIMKKHLSILLDDFMD